MNDGTGYPHDGGEIAQGLGGEQNIAVSQAAAPPAASQSPAPAAEPAPPLPPSTTSGTYLAGAERTLPGINASTGGGHSSVEAGENEAAVNICGEPVLAYPPLLPGEGVVDDGTPNYFDWKELFPELQVLVHGMSEIFAECSQVSNWKAWPEKHYDKEGEQDWKVQKRGSTVCQRRVWVSSRPAL